MDPGDFYTYAAKIPDFHAVDDSMPQTVDYPGGIGPSHDDTPARSVGPNGRVLHEDLPGPDAPDEPNVCYPEDETQEPNVCYPDDDTATDPSAYISGQSDDAYAYASRARRGPARHQLRRHQLRRRRLTSCDPIPFTRCAGKATDDRTSDHHRPGRQAG